LILDGGFFVKKILCSFSCFGGNMSSTLRTLFALLAIHCSAFAVPMNLTLGDFLEEISKVPTRREYLYFLEGELNVLSVFAQASEEAYFEQFKQVVKNFELYRASPDLAHAENTANAILTLKSLPTKESHNINTPMLLALQNFRFSIDQELPTMTSQTKEYIRGMEAILFSFSCSFGLEFDSDFDAFDTLFDDFILQPSEEKRLNLLQTLKQLEILIHERPF
jgi:hypothetical protein